MRLISFFLTERQFLDGSKTETRRLGWENLRPGDRLMGVRKGQGLGKGGKVHRLGEIEALDVKRERLNKIDQAGVVAEGFPDLTPEEFVAMFRRHMKKARPQTTVTRIRFRHVTPKGTP